MWPCRRLLRRASLLLVTLLGLAACAASEHPPGPQRAELPTAVYPSSACLQPDFDLRESVVPVLTDTGARGSGVVIGPGMVVTAAHVVSRAAVVDIQVAQTRRRARVAAVDPVQDLALLHGETRGLAPLTLTRTPLQRFEEVWALGYPLALDLAVTQGRYRGVTEGALHVSLWIAPGASGGGLLRCNRGQFELAGLLLQYVSYQHGDRARNASQALAAPAAAVRAFAAASGVLL